MGVEKKFGLGGGVEGVMWMVDEGGGKRSEKVKL